MPVRRWRKLSPAEMTPAEFMIRMLIALLGGMLIGLERERAQISSKAKPVGSIPGMRSFGLLSVFGALSAYTLNLAGESPAWEAVLVIGYISTLALVLLYAYTRMVVHGVHGITTYIVLLATFIAGSLAGAGMILESAGISVLITLTLALKHPAEKAAAAISYRELLAMIEVAALALILGPIVRAYSASAGLDLIFKTYLFFVVILILSFTSYMAAKVWGARGIVYASLLGALVNSEATIASLVQASRLLPPEARRRALNRLAPMVILVAQIKLVLLAILGVLIFTGRLPPEILVYTGLLLLYLTVTTYIASTMLRGLPVEATLEKGPVEIASPLSWSTAIKSAAAYAVMAVVFLGMGKLGLQGGALAPIALSFLGSLVSATAVILSLGTALPVMKPCVVVASIAAVLAAVSVNKILYVRAAGAGREEARIVERWSLLLAVAPLAITVTAVALC